MHRTINGIRFIMGSRDYHVPDATGGGSPFYSAAYASTARLRTSASACDTGGMQMIIKVMIASGTR